MTTSRPSCPSSTLSDGTDRRNFLALCGSAVLGGCAAPTARSQPSDEGSTAIDIDGDLSWPMGGYGARNSGFLSTTGPSTRPSLVWDVPVNGVFTLPGPVYQDGTLFFGSDSFAYAVEAESGKLVWTRELDYLAHFFSPAVRGESLYVGARTLQGARTGGGEGSLYAVSTTDGTVDWRVDAPVSSGPTLVDETLYFTSSDGLGTVHAHDTEGQEVWRWTYDPPSDAESGSIFGNPAVTRESVFVTTTAHGGDDGDRGALYALDRATGSVRWQVETESESRVAPVVDDSGTGETVYGTTAAGDVLAVDERTGEQRWHTGLGTRILTPPVVNGRALYLLTAGTVVALDLADGSARWQTDVGATRMNGLSVTSDGVYVGGTDVTALTPTDGTVRWRFPIPEGTGGYGAPIVLDGVVFSGACIKHEKGSLYDDHLFALA